MRYTVVLLAFAFFLFLSPLTAKGGEAAAAHGCASPVPPAVPGALPPPSHPYAILLNEILTRPASPWNCASAGTAILSHDAWIELYNPLDQPVDLFTVHASLDTGPQSSPFLLPLASALPPHGFLVVFPDSQSFFPSAPFVLRLLIDGSTVIDEVNVPQLNSDESFARISDGSQIWHTTTSPTPGCSNSPSVQPTPQPTSKALPPTAAPTGIGRPTNGGQTTSAARAATPRPAIAGTQPSWTNLRLPSPSPAPTTAAQPREADRSLSPPAVPSESTSAEGSLDGSSWLRPVVFGGLLVALGGSLLWCWRLFRSTPREG